MKNKEKKYNYEHHSHTHCFNNPDNPCGLEGHHCCLCDFVSTQKIDSPSCPSAFISPSEPKAGWEKTEKWEYDIEPIVNRIKKDICETVDFRELKSFISSLLFRTREEIISEIEGKLPKRKQCDIPQHDTCRFWNECYDQILSILSSIKRNK